MKLKITIDGKEHEVEHTDVSLPEGAQILEPGKAPEGFVSQEFFEDEIKRRGKGLVKKSTLLDDDDFFREAASKRSIKLGDDGKPVTAKEVDVEELERDWTKTRLEPLQKDVEKLSGFNKKLLSRTKRAGLLQAAEKYGIKPHLRRRVGDDPSPVEAMFEKRFAYDPETDDFGQVQKLDEDGNPVFKYSPNPQERRHANFDDFFKSLHGDKEFAEWFDEKKIGSSGIGDPGGGSGTVRLSAEEARDPRKFADAEKRAQEAGTKVVIG